MPTYIKKLASQIKPKLEEITDLKLENIIQEKPKVLLNEPKVVAKSISKKLITPAILDQTPTTTDPKIDQRISMLEKSFKTRTNFLVAIVLIVVCINLIFLFLRPQSSNQSVAVEPAKTNSVASSDNKLKVVNQASVYIFENNPAIFDFGFKIDLKPDHIANLNDPNCQTPIVPPTVNGCGFALDLQKIGLPKNAVYFRYATIETDAMTSSQKIQIDLKDYQKGELTQNIGLIEGGASTHKIALPANIASSQSLYFRFWAPQNVIKIKKITIEYFSTIDLKPVTINFDTVFKEAKTGRIYLDTDSDGKFTQNIDKRWECTPTFPGVLPINLKDQASTKLIREDGCMTENKLESWASDAGLNSLPASKWLLVIDGQTSASFETKTDNQNSSFDLKL